MNISTVEQKQVLIRFYAHISALERAIDAMQYSGTDKFTVSVLGNFGQEYNDNTQSLTNKSGYLRNFFITLLGANAELDSFYNPEIGRVFVAGFLVPMFLHRVGQKKIGALFGGPYGILRGLGISEAKANSCLKMLSDGKYLLLVRGNRLDIENLEAIL